MSHEDILPCALIRRGPLRYLSVVALFKPARWHLLTSYRWTNCVLEPGHCLLAGRWSRGAGDLSLECRERLDAQSLASFWDV